MGDQIRIYRIDGSSILFDLAIPWELLIHNFVFHGVVVTNIELMDRKSILRIERMPADALGQVQERPSAQVLRLVPPTEPPAE